MSLGAHAAIGAIVANQFTGYPVIGFFAAFASHFILDMIPHWDYNLGSMRQDESNPLNNTMVINRDFVVDLFKIGFDFSLGLAASWLFFMPYNLNILKITLVGVAGGVLPDFLQFVYMKMPFKPVILLQRFHIWIHTKNHLKGQPLFGIISQAVFVLIVFYMIG